MRLYEVTRDTPDRPGADPGPWELYYESNGKRSKVGTFYSYTDAVCEALSASDSRRAKAQVSDNRSVTVLRRRDGELTDAGLRAAQNCTRSRGQSAMSQDPDEEFTGWL